MSFQTAPPPGGSEKMRESLIASIVQKAKGDKAFGLKILKNPAVALSSYKLSKVETAEVILQVKKL